MSALPKWHELDEEAHASLDGLAAVLCAALRLPHQAMFKTRANDTLLARQAFAYCAVTFLEAPQNIVAAYLGVSDRKEIYTNVQAFMARSEHSGSSRFAGDAKVLWGRTTGNVGRPRAS